jgi:hypothetical protein
LSLGLDCVAVWASWRVLSAWGLWAFVALWVSPFFTGSAVSGLETHAVACLLLVAPLWPGGYLLAAALRPDAAFLSLAAAGRKWRWALAGAVAFGLISLAYAGQLVPQTISSKAAVYGIHPGGWIWLHPKGFGWMTLAFVVPVLGMLKLAYGSCMSLWKRGLRRTQGVQALQGDLYAGMAQEAASGILDAEARAPERGIKAKVHGSLLSSSGSRQGIDSSGRLRRVRGSDYGNAPRGLFQAIRRNLALPQAPPGAASLTWGSALPIAAAAANLLTHVAIGTTAFWWLAVPPLALLSLAACRVIKTWWQLVIALAVIAGFWHQQAEVLHDRIIGERGLYSMALKLKALQPTGTILLEPAGIIPYFNPQLRAFDDVGLIDPWMAHRRAAGPGWRTDACEHYRPRWLIMRGREVYARELPGFQVGRYSPNFGTADRMPPGYVPVIANGGHADSTRVGNKLVIRYQVSMRWSSLIVLERKGNPQ